VGFRIEEPLVPRDPAFEKVAQSIGADPTALLLAGGEEYELLFTVDGARRTEFEHVLRTQITICGATVIGTIVADPAVREVSGRDGARIDVATQGFDHFVTASVIGDS
jgi:thiamine monophosphate kinase